LPAAASPEKNKAKIVRPAKLKIFQAIVFWRDKFFDPGRLYLAGLRVRPDINYLDG